MVRRRSTPALIGLLALLLTATPAAADIIGLYGGENVGTAGGTFLRIPVGARAVALGRAYSACATDGAAVFWNPAGIMRTPGRRNLFFSHVEYAADIDLNFIAYHWRRQNFGFGLMAGVLDSGDIPRTDDFHQEGIPGVTFKANQYYAGLTLTRAMTDRFSLGGTFKVYQENLDEFVVRSWMLDMGILYFLGAGDWRVGFSVRNFGPNMRPGGEPPAITGYEAMSEFQSFAAPTVGDFGTAFTLNLSRNITLLSTFDFHHPSDYSESFSGGWELGLGRNLFLRAGIETNRDEGGLSAGFGVATFRDSFDLRLDYGYSDMGNFGTIHHVSMDLVPLIGRKPR